MENEVVNPSILTVELDIKASSEDKFSKKNYKVMYYNMVQGRVYTSTMMTTELEHRVLSYEELETILDKIMKDLAKRLLVDKSASVDVEKPDLEDEVITNTMLLKMMLTRQQL